MREEERGVNRIISTRFGRIRTATVALVVMALMGTIIPLTATIVSANGDLAKQWNLNGEITSPRANTGSATDRVLGQRDSSAGAIPSGIPKAGTAGVLMQGYLDAGGPYVGNEGDTITFTATDTGSPSPLVFIRWDFEGDGKWDKTPSYDPVFGWSMDWTVAWTIADDLHGDLVKVEAWDGFSSTTEVATAYIDVYNVAPSVSNVAVSPTIGYEGSSISLTGMFTDPGVKDDWSYRANWGDGTFSNWIKVNKWEVIKKPRVLFLHTLALGNGYQIMKDALTAACGSDCATVDMWEFGQDPPYAYNRLPTLAEALQYDVIVVASNTCQWYTRGRVLAGNLLADYADKGGGVVAMEASFYPISGSCGAGIGTLSRWYNQGYTPLGTGYLTNYGPTRYLGQVYDPSHYLMDGVNNVKAYMIHSITDVRPGAVRIADWETGEVMVATKENPMVPNGARVVALNFFPGPYTKISYGAALDWDRLWHNSVLWASHSAREKTLPIAVGPLTHVYGDNYLYPAALEVQDDDGGLGDGPISIDVENVNPEVVGNIEAYTGGSLTLRVAGEKWHDVTATIYLNGVETYVGSIVRMPGSPDDQAVTLGNISFDLRGNDMLSAKVVYTPMDDPINGQLWGATPAWLIFRSEHGDESSLKHTFNVRHNDTWTWDVPDLKAILVGIPIDFTATAADPGSDDLTFVWNWGDGSSVSSVTVYNNGVSPDPYPSPEINPITATVTVQHAFTVAGMQTITLKVIDDDGGFVVAIMITTLNGVPSLMIRASGFGMVSWEVVPGPP
jgi:hypothetical protein